MSCKIRRKKPLNESNNSTDVIPSFGTENQTVILDFIKLLYGQDVYNTCEAFIRRFNKMWGGTKLTFNADLSSPGKIYDILENVVDYAKLTEYMVKTTFDIMETSVKYSPKGVDYVITTPIIEYKDVRKFVSFDVKSILNYKTNHGHGNLANELKEKITTLLNIENTPELIQCYQEACHGNIDMKNVPKTITDLIILINRNDNNEFTGCFIAPLICCISMKGDKIANKSSKEVGVYIPTMNGPAGEISNKL